jgi:hypothetical protein
MGFPSVSTAVRIKKGLLSPSLGLLYRAESTEISKVIVTFSRGTVICISLWQIFF